MHLQSVCEVQSGTAKWAARKNNKKKNLVFGGAA
jgi:hypothetical protein